MGSAAFICRMKGIAVFIAWIPFAAFAQPDAGHSHPAFHVDEVGIGVAPVFQVAAEGGGTALHAHYIHHVGRTALGLGADLEHVFAHHEQSSFMAVLQWSPHPFTHFVFAPGLCHAARGPWDPALHLEAFQDFHWHGMAVGPFVEWAFEPGTQQMELGVHLGVPLGGRAVEPAARHPHRRTE